MRVLEPVRARDGGERRREAIRWDRGDVEVAYQFCDPRRTRLERFSLEVFNFKHLVVGSAQSVLPSSEGLLHLRNGETSIAIHDGHVWKRVPLAAHFCHVEILKPLRKTSEGLFDDGAFPEMQCSDLRKNVLEQVVVDFDSARYEQDLQIIQNAL